VRGGTVISGSVLNADAVLSAEVVFWGGGDVSTDVAGEYRLHKSIGELVPEELSAKLPVKVKLATTSLTARFYRDPLRGIEQRGQLGIMAGSRVSAVDSYWDVRATGQFFFEREMARVRRCGFYDDDDRGVRNGDGGGRSCRYGNRGENAFRLGFGVQADRELTGVHRVAGALSANAQIGDLGDQRVRVDGSYTIPLENGLDVVGRVKYTSDGRPTSGYTQTDKYIGGGVVYRW